MPRGVERVDGIGEFEAERIAGVERPRDGDERLGEVGVHTPVAALIGVGQSRPGDGAGTDAEVGQTWRGPQAGLDVAQALAIGELRKSQAEKLIPAGETPQPVAGPEARHRAPELVLRHEIHQLRKHRAAFVHRPPLCRRNSGRFTSKLSVTD
jgi:hypothetical protein